MTPLAIDTGLLALALVAAAVGSALFAWGKRAGCMAALVTAVVSVGLLVAVFVLALQIWSGR